MELWQSIFIGIGIFLVLRIFAVRYLFGLARKRAFYRQYAEIINLPEYRVKGNQ